MDNNAAIHIIAAKTIESSTAALPISFARLAWMWYSGEIRSTIDSNEEFNNSTISIRLVTVSNKHLKRIEMGMKINIGRSKTKSKSSCLNADSYLNADVIPSIE